VVLQALTQRLGRCTLLSARLFIRAFFASPQSSDYIFSRLSRLSGSRVGRIAVLAVHR
jgi:hypothetical protein